VAIFIVQEKEMLMAVRGNNKTMKKLQKPTAQPAPTQEVKDKRINTIFVKTFSEALRDGFYDIAEFSRHFLNVNPTEVQQNVGVGVRDTLESTISAANRTGKSHWVAQWLAWRAFYRYHSSHYDSSKLTPHNTYKAVSVSMTLEQAKLSWNYALTFAQDSPRFKHFIEDVRMSPFPEIKLRTKNEHGDWVISEIWARSIAKKGLYLLGQSLSAVAVDECAFIKDYPEIEDNVIRMRLADQCGSILRVSAPNGRNFFYDYYLKGLNANGEPSSDSRYFSYKITSWENPWVPRQYLEQMKAVMIPEYYQQNIMAEFVSLSDFFPLKAIGKLYEDVDYELPDSLAEAKADVGGNYVMGVDLGAQRDPTVIIVIKVSDSPKMPHEVVFVKELRNPSWRRVREYIMNVALKYGCVRICIDGTGNGGPVAQALIEEDGLQNAESFVFTPSSKPQVLTTLQDAVQQRRFVFPMVTQTKTLIQQLSFYVLDDKKINQDWVISLGLANRALDLFQRQGHWYTEVPDSLAIINIKSGGRDVPHDLVYSGDVDAYEGGFAFKLNQDSGLFEPIDQMGGDNLCATAKGTTKAS
jgi:hypothetical protein